MSIDTLRMRSITNRHIKTIADLSVANLSERVRQECRTDSRCAAAV